jgi:hypothetical protein
MKIKYLLIASLLFSTVIQAGVYTWIDENGKKHFGDVIPPQYAGQVDGVDVKIHTPTEEQIKSAKDRAAKGLDKINSRTNTKKSRVTKSKKRTQPKKKKSNDFDSRMSEYRDSIACFNKCRRPIYTYNKYNQKIFHGYDNSACGHCKNVVRPTR